MAAVLALVVGLVLAHSLGLTPSAAATVVSRALVYAGVAAAVSAPLMALFFGIGLAAFLLQRLGFFLDMATIDPVAKTIGVLLSVFSLVGVVYPLVAWDPRPFAFGVLSGFLMAFGGWSISRMPPAVWHEFRDRWHEDL